MTTERETSKINIVLVLTVVSAILALLGIASGFFKTSAIFGFSTILGGVACIMNPIFGKKTRLALVSSVVFGIILLTFAMKSGFTQIYSSSTMPKIDNALMQAKVASAKSILHDIYRNLMQYRAETNTLPAQSHVFFDASRENSIWQPMPELPTVERRGKTDFSIAYVYYGTQNDEPIFEIVADGTGSHDFYARHITPIRVNSEGLFSGGEVAQVEGNTAFIIEKYTAKPVKP